MKGFAFRIMELGKVALLAMVVGFSSLIASNAGAQGNVPAVNATVNDNVVVSNVLYAINIGGTDATLGWAFTSSQNLLLTSLGGLLMGDISGSSLPIDVGLWSANGTLLSSAVITSSSQLINGSLYQAISPISIIAGNTYIIAVGTPGDFNVAQVAANTTQSPISFAGAAVLAGHGFSFPTIALPIAPDNSIIYGANFLFQPVPEPGVLGLLAMGGAGLVWHWRRSNSNRDRF
jgi:hypothetical protein